MIDPQLDIKQKFVHLCSMIFINATGKFVFPIENLQYDADWSEFLMSSDWSILDKKMSNLITKLNEDNSILNLDVETEIWEMV
jgi:hypothetical protein